MSALAISCDHGFGVWRGVGSLVSELRDSNATVTVDQAIEEY